MVDQMGDSDSKVEIYRHLISQNVPVLEWRYEQRREMQEILPSIYLGPYSATRNLEDLKTAHITHIISLWDVSESRILKIHHPDHFKYLQLEISDAATQNLITLFPAVKQFIDQAILKEGGNVLVNCMSGISRSPAFVVAYLMETTGLEYEVVYRYVQNKRFCMNPNPGFRHQLEEYGPIYTAIQSMGSQPTEQRTSMRRSAPEGDDNEDMERQAPRFR
ncbi:phosphatases II [Dissophora ornata]|nr:phosphatases II [Dissophora ornata]